VLLQRDFLERYRISQTQLAHHIGHPASNLNSVIHSHRDITPHLAWLLAMALGTTPEFWMERQVAYDLHRVRPQTSLPAMSQLSKQRPARRLSFRRGLFLRKWPEDREGRGFGRSRSC
jgi:addiction module HigA family antidote